MITIPDNIDSKYRFVILSALRARQIQGGSSPMLKEERNKATAHLVDQLGLPEYFAMEAIVVRPPARPASKP